MQLDNTENVIGTVRESINARQVFKPSWLFSLIIQPRSTLAAVLERDRAVWLIPLVILTTLVAIEAVLFSHLRMTEMANQIRNLEFMKDLTPEEQAFQFRLIGPPIRPLYVYVAPIVYSVGRLWIVWFSFGLLMNLVLTWSGAKSSIVKTLNAAAWAFLPLGLRYVIQSGAMLASQEAILNRGLSSLLSSGEPTQQASFFTPLLVSLLGSIDIFFLWTALLLIVAVVVGFHLPNRGKAIGIGLTSVLLTLFLMALSGFLVTIGHHLFGLGVFQRAAWYFQLAW